ncbi:ABC transporter substrate-binding protein [Nakamurella lactea]|uniref:ABC transporter substrate-binding protein n=1 Tax=Nakamurella lactea TaxID=459515 RepID=UPI0004100DEF|nr:ABC transporter substrate-binding protein [Nakamurella lactea]
MARKPVSASLFNVGMNRRDLLRRSAMMAGGALALGGAGSLLAACGGDPTKAAQGGEPAVSGGGGSNKKVVVADWGGAIQDAEKTYLYEPFTKETGIEVVISGPPSDAKIKAMVDSGNVEWDLVAGSKSNVLSLGSEYFEEFPERLHSIKGMDPAFTDKQAIAYYVFSTNIGWNAETLNGKKMENWADFFDTSTFPGKRTMGGIEGGGNPELEFALLADGVARDKLYPLDVDRAFKKMEEIKGSVPQWWSSGSQPGQMLVSKQVAAASIWSGRVFTLQGEKAPIDFTWNDGMYTPAAWIIPKGAQNKDAAIQLAEYSVQPEVQARLWGNYPCGPTNSLALAKMDEEWAIKLPTHPDHAAVQFINNAEWWGENRDMVFKRWNEFSL